VVFTLVLCALGGLAWVVSVERMRGVGMGDRFASGALGAFLALWVVMMAAMMFPSVAPAVTVHAMVMRRRDAAAAGLSTAFVAGYLAAWATAGLVAYGLLRGVSASPVGSLSDDALARYVVAPVALGAAVYEFTPVKHVCLSQCRGPLTFLLRYWREGRVGALWMGVRHGGYCVGCCWALMLVLLAIGVMSVTWMAILALAIAFEKLTPRFGRRASVVVAVGLCGLASSLWEATPCCAVASR
jgi:predicted metal-binding membrane protein